MKSPEHVIPLYLLPVDVTNISLGIVASVSWVMLELEEFVLLARNTLHMTGTLTVAFVIEATTSWEKK